MIGCEGMTKKKKLNINAVKRYYIRHNISLQKLAERYKISYSTVCRYKKEGNWDEEKAAYVAELNAKAMEQMQEEDTKALVDAQKKLTGIISSAVAVLDGISHDQQQFNRQYTSPNERLYGNYEYISTKVDTKSMLNYIKAISEVNNIIKSYTEKDNTNNGITIGFEEMEKEYAE